MTPPDRLLLDTCAVIRLVNADPALPVEVIDAIRHAAGHEGIYVSTATALEAALLSRPKPNRPPALEFLPDVRTWFVTLLSMPGVQEAPITPWIAVDSCNLPGEFHADPMDRLIVATARKLGIPMVTSDARIRAYAKQGHVTVVAC